MDLVSYFSYKEQEIRIEHSILFLDQQNQSVGCILQESVLRTFLFLLIVKQWF